MSADQWRQWWNEGEASDLAPIDELATVAIAKWGAIPEPVQAAAAHPERAYWDSLYRSQEGRCARCRVPLNLDHFTFDRDHHKVNKGGDSSGCLVCLPCDSRRRLDEQFLVVEP